MAGGSLYIIGAGMIARHHAKAAALLPGRFGAYHFCDLSEAARADFGADHPAYRAWSRAEEMLAQPASEGDVVIVATPPFTHAVLAEAAMRSGRHALIEKPLAMDESQLRRLLEVSKQCGRTFSDCSVRYLGGPLMERAQGLMPGLGSLRQARWVHRGRRCRAGVEYQPESPWFISRSRAGGGILWDWGPYDLSVLFSLAQPLAFEVRHAWGRRFVNGTEPVGAVYDVDTHVFAACRLHLEGGGILELHYERAVAHHGREESISEIEGDLGALTLGWDSWEGGTYLVLGHDDEGRPRDQKFYAPAGPLSFQSKPLYYFVARLRGQEGFAHSPGRACFHQACILAIEACISSGLPQKVQRSEWE